MSHDFVSRNQPRERRSDQARWLRDAPGFYTTENEFRGVWFFDRPSDANDDPRDDTVLAVDLPLSAADLDAYEWKQEGKSHREWLIPAAFVNKYWWPTSS